MSLRIGFGSWALNGRRRRPCESGDEKLRKLGGGAQAFHEYAFCASHKWEPMHASVKQRRVATLLGTILHNMS
eukprot:2868368-Pleurochrysis_carterae.AAC.2